MTLRYFQKGFNFRQDGPGNRLVYHLQGCNLHCPWCSNPEGMPMTGAVEVGVDEVVAECERSRKLMVGGGVTFTGGEATVQPEALLAALKALRREGIHTALETNGTSPRLCEIAAEVDWLALDFKHVDAVRFGAMCGGGFETLVRNYRELVARREQLQVRVPLVNGFNADDAEAFAAYFAALPHDRAVFEFLRYHEYGKGKWKTPYGVQNGFVTDEQYRSFVKSFRENGMKVGTT